MIMSTMYVITPDAYTQTEELCYQLSTAPECNTLPSYLCDQTGVRFVHGGKFHSHFDWSSYGGHDAGKITLVPIDLRGNNLNSYNDTLIESVLNIQADKTIFIDRPDDDTFNRAWKHRCVMMFERMVFTGTFLDALIAGDMTEWTEWINWFDDSSAHPDDSTNFRTYLKNAGFSNFELDFAINDGRGKANWEGFGGESDAYTLADLAADEIAGCTNDTKRERWNSKLTQALHISMKDMNDSRGSVITSLAGKGITATESMFEMYNGMLDGTDDSSTAITDASLITAIQTKVNHTGTFNYVAP
jgi:hypothetical protein